MKRTLTLLLAILLFAAAPVYACTGVYVGKEVSAEGTTLIGRSEDQGSGVCNKMFFVQPASSQSGREMVEHIGRFVDRPAEVNGHHPPQYKAQNNFAGRRHSGQYIRQPFIEHGRWRINDISHNDAHQQ